MNVKILFVCMLFFVIFSSLNSVFAENFSDLNQQINNGDDILLNKDIVLNQNTSNEENVFNQGISINNREISIDGNNHAICAEDLYENQVRVFNITNSNVTLSNIIITSANFNSSGGAIYLDSASNLILNNVTFKDNSAGGIYGEGGVIFSLGSLSVYDSVFENNYASGAGGAILSTTSNCFIYSSKFINNTAEWYGGAVYSDGQFEVSSAIFDSNNAYSGAAIHFSVGEYSWTLKEYAVLYNSSFTNNVADFGAAISSSSIKHLFAVDCNFTENLAYKGGVFYKNSVCKSYLYGCLIENNTAKNGAVFYDVSFDSVDYDEEEEEEIFSLINVFNSIFKNNFASDKAPMENLLIYGLISLSFIIMQIMQFFRGKVILQY